MEYGTARTLQFPISSGFFQISSGVSISCGWDPPGKTFTRLFLFLPVYFSFIPGLFQFLAGGTHPVKAFTRLFPVASGSFPDSSGLFVLFFPS